MEIIAMLFDGVS